MLEENIYYNTTHTPYAKWLCEESKLNLLCR